MHAHTARTKSFYTLTINLQPIAQLDSVAMANILPPESSAEIGAREAERGRVILNMRLKWCTWVKGRTAIKQGGGKRTGGVQCILIGVT